MDQVPQRMTSGGAPHWNPRDDEHLRRVCTLRPEVDTQLGSMQHAGELGSLAPEARGALLEALTQWRAELETQMDVSRERTLDVRVFAASLELFRFTEEHVGLHAADPDLGTPLFETLVYHLRGHAPDEQERFATLARRLRGVAPHLASGRPVVTRPSVELLARARDVMDGAPDLLRAISDAGRQAAAAELIPPSLAQDVQTAADLAGAAIEEQRTWLATLAPASPQALGLPVLDELLRLRGLDLTAGEVLDLSRSIGEELRLEANRAAQRARKRGAPRSSIDDTVAAERAATTPQSLGEAMAWLADLTHASREFVTAHGLVALPHANRERILVEAMPSVLAPLGHAVLHVPPQPLAPLQESLLLVREPLGSMAEALRELSVADLENSVAALGFPGSHLQAVWTNLSTAAPRRGAPLGAFGAVAGTWGQDMVQGWSSTSEELLREAQFRSSPASRLVMVRRALLFTLLAAADVSLAAGRMTPEQAAAFLVRRAGARLPVARALVRSLLRSPTLGLSALVGKVRIEQLRREARKAWRDTFSEMRFNSLMLASGPLPLAYLFERVQDPPPTLNNDATVSPSGSSSEGAV